MSEYVKKDISSNFEGFKRNISSEYAHDLYKSLFSNMDTIPSIISKCQKNKQSNLLKKWIVFKARPELPVYTDPFTIYGTFSKRYNSTGQHLGFPTGFIDVTWFLKSKEDGNIQTRSLCHEIKTGIVDLDDIMKYHEQSVMIYDTPILPARSTENQLWVWGWSENLESAKENAGNPKVKDWVKKGIIRLNPLEIINDLYEEVRMHKL